MAGSLKALDRGGKRLERARWLARLALVSLMAACTRGEPGRKHAFPPNRLAGEPRAIAQALAQAGSAGADLRLPDGDTMHAGPSAVAFYRARGWRPAWTDDDGLTGTGRAVVTQLARAEDDGLSPERYHYSDVQRLAALLQGGGAARANAAAGLDILISEAFARYADDLAAGSLDPKQLGLEWHLGREHAPKLKVLDLLASGARPDSIVAGLRPHTAAYTRMMQALARYRSIAAAGGWPLVGARRAGTSAGIGAAAPPDATDTTAAPASAARAPRVGTTAGVRARLLAGEDTIEAALAAAGKATPTVLDPRLRQAIAHFQQRMGLQPTGRPTPETIRQLDVPVQDRIQTLVLNMDRWRWLPRDLGAFRVLVNIPAFRVDVLQGDSTVMAQKVVVGKQGWSTPVFADRMVALIVNPYWNVPKSIVASELGPDMAKDPDYLAKHHFVPTPDGGYKQLPGPKNSLGRYKFQLTNDEDIYLHDTPQGELFSKSQRAFSHGCIRLQDARAMAYLVGQHEGIDPQTIDRLVASGDNHTLDFKSPVPTYIMYFTATARPDGTIDFYPDVYGIDRRLAPLTPALQGRPVDTTRIAQDSAQVADSIKAEKASHRGQATD